MPEPTVTDANGVELKVGDWVRHASMPSRRLCIVQMGDIKSVMRDTVSTEPLFNVDFKRCNWLKCDPLEDG